LSDPSVSLICDAVGVGCWCRWSGVGWLLLNVISKWKLFGALGG
jgi:hypothetical protein